MQNLLSLEETCRQLELSCKEFKILEGLLLTAENIVADRGFLYDFDPTSAVLLVRRNAYELGNFCRAADDINISHEWEDPNNLLPVGDAISLAEFAKAVFNWAFNLDKASRAATSLTFP